MGSWRIPVAFRLWRSKAHSRPGRYRTKMIVEVLQAGLPIQYVVFGMLCTAIWLTKRVNRLGLTWVGVLHSNTTVYDCNQFQKAASLGNRVRLKWRARLQLRARSMVAYLPKYGTIPLVVTKNRQGNVEVLATHDLTSDLTTLVLRKRSRWSIETLFRDVKQFCGLMTCQCRVDQALVRHVALVLLGFVVLQRLRLHPKETLDEVKEWLQRELFTGGIPPPPSLRGKVPATQLLTA